VKRGNECSGTAKCRTFLEQMRNCCRLEKDKDPLSKQLSQSVSKLNSLIMWRRMMG